MRHHVVRVHSFWIFLADCEHYGAAVSSAYGWLAGPSLVCVCVCAGGWSRHKAKVMHALMQIESQGLHLAYAFCVQTHCELPHCPSILAHLR